MAQRQAPLRTQRQDTPGAQRLQDATGDALRTVQREKRKRAHHVPRNADSAASTTTAEYPLFQFDGDEKLQSLAFVGRADVAKDGTDYAEFTFRHRDGEGGEAVVLVKYSTAEGALTAWRPKSFSLTREIPIGGVLTVEIAKGGAGQTLPAGTYRAVTVEVRS